MEKDKNLVKIFTKLSIATNILPFLGFAQEWKGVYMGLCTETKKFYQDNEEQFTQFEQQVFPYYNQIAQLVRYYELPFAHK